MVQVGESKGTFSMTRCRLIEPRKRLGGIGCTRATALGLHPVGGEAGANPVKGLLARRRNPELDALLSVQSIDGCRTFALRRGVVSFQCRFQQVQRGWFDALVPISSCCYSIKQSQIATTMLINGLVERLPPALDRTLWSGRCFSPCVGEHVDHALVGRLLCFR